MLDSLSSYVQGLGVAGQKIFGPGLTQMIVDNAIFRGYPVSGLANGIAVAMGPQSAKDWVRYLENKGIDPNNVQEADISYWRSALDNFLKDDSVSEPGKTGFDVLLNDTSEGGLQAKYLAALNDYIEGITNKPMDRMQPAEIISVLNDQLQSSLARGEKYIYPENYFDFLERDLSGLSTKEFLDEMGYDKVGFGENNEFYFDEETIDRLKEAFPDITDAEYEAGFDYLISEGEQGQAFTEGVGYDITSDASFYATNYVDEGDYITMQDVPAVASDFEYRTNEQGDEFVYDPMSGVTYEFEQARLSDQPGTRDDLYVFPSLTVEALNSSDRTLNKEILKELALTGKLEYKELRQLAIDNPSVFSAASSDVALANIDAELGDFYLRKYAGFTDENLGEDFVLPEGLDLGGAVLTNGNRARIAVDTEMYNAAMSRFPGFVPAVAPTLENILIQGNYTDSNFDVSLGNEVYNEDYVEESIFELRPFTVIDQENGVPTSIQDNVYGFQEDYDPNRYNENTGEYLFREYSADELKFIPSYYSDSQ
jgi:hypothetical protein